MTISIDCYRNSLVVPLSFKVCLSMIQQSQLTTSSLGSLQACTYFSLTWVLDRLVVLFSTHVPTCSNRRSSAGWLHASIICLSSNTTHVYHPETWITCQLTPACLMIISIPLTCLVTSSCIGYLPAFNAG